MRGRRPRTAHEAYTPKVDVYGTLKSFTGDEVRGRLIEYAPSQFAFFTATDRENPLTFTTEGEFQVKGRVLTAMTTGGEIRFQKAGCGCETPHELRGARKPLLEFLPQPQSEPESEEVET